MVHFPPLQVPQGRVGCGRISGPASFILCSLTGDHSTTPSSPLLGLALVTPQEMESILTMDCLGKQRPAVHHSSKDSLPEASFLPPSEGQMSPERPCMVPKAESPFEAKNNLPIISLLFLFPLPAPDLLRLIRALGRCRSRMLRQISQGCAWEVEEAQLPVINLCSKEFVPPRTDLCLWMEPLREWGLGGRRS